MDKLKEIILGINNWDEATQAERLSTIRDLKKISNISTCQVPKNSDLSCPEYGHVLSTPCGLSKCSFYVQNPKSFNCIYHSLDNSKKKKLTPSEASNCLGIPVNQINQHLNSAINKIRVTKMQDDILAERSNKFVYIEGTCINCGQNIQDELDLGKLNQNLIVEFGKFGYCSDSCKKEKPIWKFNLERKYNTDWEYVIIKFLEYTKAIKANSKEIDSLVGIDINNLSDKDKLFISLYKKLYNLY